MKVMPDTSGCVGTFPLAFCSLSKSSHTLHYPILVLENYDSMLYHCYDTVLQSLDCIKCNHKVTHHGLHLVGTWQER